MQICLPVEYPPITSFPYIANSLSILWVKKDKVLPWICDRYIQLVIRPHHSLTRSDFYENADTDNFVLPGNYCPFLGWLRNNQTTANFNQFTDYIEYQIKQGYYLDACLDSYYLSCTNYFKKKHFIHQTFIYGFDDEKRQVYISDFYDGKYVRKIVSYDEINKSIKGIDYFINLYKYEEFDYKINLELLKVSTNDYINGRDSLNKYKYSYQSYNKDILYGMNFYNYILDVFINEKIIDIRPFHILYDHKKIMNIRLEYLKKLGIIDKDKIDNIFNLNNLLIEQSLLLRNMVLKYNINHNKSIKDEIYKKCLSVKESDYELFDELLKCL